MRFTNLGISFAYLFAAASAIEDGHHRRLVQPHQSIADEVHRALAQNRQNDGSGNGKTGNGKTGNGKTGNGHGKAKFTLQANKAGGGLFETKVREATSAITATTTVTGRDGVETTVPAEKLATILVGDVEESSDTVVLTVLNGEVNGVVDSRGRNGRAMKFTQRKGKMAQAFDAPEFTPQPWACGYSENEQIVNADEDTTRHLLEDHHDHHDHDHHDHLPHHHDEHDVLDLTELKESLRGSTLRLGKRRKLQEGGVGYGYQVDMYIEVDSYLCTNNGDTTACPGPNTINYVNAIFAGANTVYEEEIDTHLSIVHLAYSTLYNSASDSSNALGIMRSNYASTSTWHYGGTDLHHALLGKGLGGGVAYLGQICSSNYGFGLSGGIAGSFVDMDQSVVWDMMVFMHEVGHNFNSGHTHEDAAYVPRIDTCGCSYSTACSDACPAELPLAASATIMSYCHICSGGYANMDYTFGGKYTGGSRSSVDSYTNSPLAGTVSNNPRQVNAKMWQHVSTRSCTGLPPNTPTRSPTPYPTSGPTIATPNPTPTPCPDGTMAVSLDIQTDNYPGETTWFLTNTCSGIKEASGGPYSNANTFFPNSYCLPSGAYTFTIADTWGDGICCSYGSGHFSVRSNGEEVATGGAFGTGMTTNAFGSCAATPDPTPGPTVPVTPGPTSIPTTPIPTPSPTTSPTPNPTPSPTPNPTKIPTDSPTKHPTDSPSNIPTPSPTVSVAPSPFVPEVVELNTPNTNSATILRAGYFQVENGDNWAKITDLNIFTYSTKQIEVYYKQGIADGYEFTPCAWKKVAETAPTWNGGTWGRFVYPAWVNGFDPVVLVPNATASFYIVNVGASYGILGMSHSNSNKYQSPYISLPATSAVGAVAISHGKGGYNDQRFNAYPSTWSGRSIYGGVKLETMMPGSTQAPTFSPTAPYTPGLLESPIMGTDAEVIGLQFDVNNSGLNDVIINKFSVLFSTVGSKNIEVWSRDGSHKDVDSAGCDRWNNWCNAWTLLASGVVNSLELGSFTDTPTFIGIVKASGVTSFAIVSGDGLLATTASTDIVSDGVLAINPASPIEDHYGNSVQTTHALSSTSYVFQGVMYYDIANSVCAIQSKASWVIMDPGVGGMSVGSLAMSDGMGESEEIVKSP